jgi:hypothetical protein
LDEQSEHAYRDLEYMGIARRGSDGISNLKLSPLTTTSSLPRHIGHQNPRLIDHDPVHAPQPPYSSKPVTRRVPLPKAKDEIELSCCAQSPTIVTAVGVVHGTKPTIVTFAIEIC